MKALLKKAFLGIVAIIGFSVATAVPAHESAYVTDSGGTAVVRSGANLCWRSGFWTPANAIAECDPDLVKKEEAPMKKAEAPKAVAKPAPAKMAPEKIALSADALFDFDKAILKAAGKETLDSLAATLSGVEYDVIIAVGHADRIGSEAYNQKLSERRANAVKSYLVSKGIAADRIEASGKGETMPVTTDCTMKASKALIACLQPDRRVEVSVEGAKK